MQVIAEIVEKCKLPTFAAWRWGTLCEVCNKLSGYLSSLVAHFDPAPFRTSRDLATLRLVTEALLSTQWRSRFEFLRWDGECR